MSQILKLQAGDWLNSQGSIEDSIAALPELSVSQDRYRLAYEAILQHCAVGELLIRKCRLEAISEVPRYRLECERNIPISFDDFADAIVHSLKEIRSLLHWDDGSGGDDAQENPDLNPSGSTGSFAKGTIVTGDEVVLAI